MRRTGTLLAGLLAAGTAAAEPVGPICDDRAIRGEVLPPIEDPGGCGIANPVRVQSVAGVALDPAPIVECRTARALKGWVARDAKPAFLAGGARLEALAVAAGYTCRNVNRAEEGDLSEHARGRAVDISAFRLSDGTRLTVLEDWDAPERGAVLKRIHVAACGRFGTTLGPDADAFHQDHFHFDTAHRRRPYCR